ncbi:MAG: aspartate aminotransferase family protein [Candidatus Thermoplasmatota archaeon]|nr:aspartate aminotransferase family protein [Candidatus Thermoplasmatota archaeon]
MLTEKKSRVQKSLELWKHAEDIIMDGTQLYSKMASVGVKGVSPVYFVKADGVYAWDYEGNRYIDYTMGLGPCFVGYNNPKVKKAIQDQLEIGTIFSLPNPLEIKAAETLIDIIPCAEMVRFMKSGSEATQAAVRIARAYTGRELIIKGHYHGWHEWCLADTTKNGGIPKAYKDTVFEVKYNDIDTVKTLFEQHKNKIACVIIEPMETELPKDNYLQKLRELTIQNGALLIYDEVVTGFRFALGGAQEYFGVIPDLAVFGKAMGGGLPLSAVVGKKEIMQKAKEKIFVSSTFGGEMLSLAAFLAVVDILKTEPVHERIFSIGNKLRDGFNALAKKHGSKIECIGLGPRLDFNYRNLKGQTDLHVKTLFMQEVVKRGIYFVWNMLPSYQLSDKDIDYTLKVFDEALRITTEAERKGNVSKLLEGEPPIKVI